MKQVPAFTLLSTAIAAVLISSNPSHAQCTPDPTMAGGTVTCSGNDTDGFLSGFNDVTVLVPGSVTPAAPGTHGIALTGDDVNVQLTGTGTIQTNGGGSGIVLDGADGVVSIAENAGITVAGPAGGIQLLSTGADITVNGSISGSGHFGHGILTLGTSGTTVTVNPTGSVITTGDDSRAIDLQADDSHIILAGTVSTSGAQFTGDAAHALIVGDSAIPTTGGSISLLPTARITVDAEGAGGILASGANTQVTVADGALVIVNGSVGSMNGLPSFGIGNDSNNGVISNSGELRANPATGSIGALLRGADAVFNNLPTGTIIGGGVFPPLQLAFAFFGDGGTTATLNNTGTITGTVGNLADGNMILNNSGSGLISENVMGGAADDQVSASSLIAGDVSLDTGSDELTMTASTVGGNLDGGDDTSSADGWIDRLHIQSGTRMVTAGSLLNWEIVQLSGSTVLQADLAALAVGADAGTDAGSGLPFGLVLQNNARLALLQSLSLTGNITNSGAVDLAADNAAGTTLEVAGDFSGMGGALILEAELGDGASASDRLIVNTGAISGSTTLNVQNVGGLGAPTTGDGILLVETAGGATSTPTAFTLAGGVTAGIYRYELAFGGLADPNDGNWYLRSRERNIQPHEAVPALPNTALLVLALVLCVVGQLKVWNAAQRRN